MIKEVDRIIIKTNIEIYGTAILKTFAVEECSELIKELSKENRGAGDYTLILEELADVYYTLSMLKEAYGFSDNSINEVIDAKMKIAKEKLGIVV